LSKERLLAKTWLDLIIKATATGTRLNRTKNLVRRAFLPREKKTEKTLINEWR
jgi:hypothetical protein